MCKAAMLLVWAISVIAAASALAEQLNFSRSEQATDVQFSYAWTDGQQDARQLTFSLPASLFNRQVHKRFIPELAQQYVYIELHKAARQIDPRDARISIVKKSWDIEINVASRSQKSLEKWRAAMQQSQRQAFDRYLHDHYYSRFISFQGQEAIKPDHLRYISENKLPLLPVAQAFYETLTANSESRVYINLLLSWTQSIPYNDLENRVTSNGAGYLPPLAVIANNQGDCDSKSVLMASLIRSLLPDVSLVMIYLPQHALLGISLPFHSNEPTFGIDGTEYLLMEPTGPAELPLGEVSPQTGIELARGRYSVEVIP